MSTVFIILLSACEIMMFFLLTAPFVKRLGGSMYHYVISLLIILIFEILTTKYLAQAWEPFKTYSTYYTITFYALFIICFHFSLKADWSICVFIFGFATLVAFMIEMVTFILFIVFDLINSVKEDTWSLFYLYSSILLIIVAIRATFYNSLVGYVIRKMSTVKIYSLLILNSLFAFALYKEIVNLRTAYSFAFFNLALFLLMNLFLFIEFNRSHKLNDMILNEKKLHATITPVLINIKKQQHDFKAQLDEIALSLHLESLSRYEAPTSLTMMNSSPIAVDTFLQYPIKSIGILLFIKYRESLALGISLEIYTNVNNNRFPYNEFALTSILSNLIDNAIEACKDYEENKKITVNFEHSKVNFLFSVANTGPPISESIKKHLFEPGFTTKGLTFSRGYGLYNVKLQLNQMHGKIFSERTSEGTIFRVEIPYESEERIL